MGKESIIGIVTGILLGIMITLAGGLILYIQLLPDKEVPLTEAPLEEPLIPQEEDPGTGELEEETDPPTAQEKFDLQDLSLGMSLQQVTDIMDQPTEIVTSEYGFDWYLYANDYQQYLQVGIDNQEVFAFYNNSAAYLMEKDLIGLTKNQARERYGTPEEYILKGNTMYYFTAPEAADRFLQSGEYLVLFYDQHDNHKIHGVMKISEKTEKNLPGFHGNLSDPVREGHEKQIFHLNNAFRAMQGLPPFTWHEVAASAARKHSRDMAANVYFSHTNQQGMDPAERLTREGLTWQQYGENIAQGPNAIFANNGWINSLGHRQNMLGNTTHLGVGSAYLLNSDKGVYHTQKFVTPR